MFSFQSYIFFNIKSKSSTWVFFSFLQSVKITFFCETYPFQYFLTLFFSAAMPYLTFFILFRLLVAVSIILLGLILLPNLLSRPFVLKKMFLNSLIFFSAAKALPLYTCELNICTLYFLLSFFISSVCILISFLISFFFNCILIKKGKCFSIFLR